ncbi:MAG: hypothetical protein JW797_16170 [Bradymonadales bacterium]|nr:hypothetical protein [Bradymonadales bacterium]
MERLRTILFPGYFGNSELSRDSLSYHIGAILDDVSRDLEVQLKRGICFSCAGPHSCPDCNNQAIRIRNDLVSRLPEIRRLLATDVQAAFEGDPAAISTDETIFCYPGIQAVTNYRVAHAIYQLGVPLIARIISEQAHSTTGIDIHPGAVIGESFFIDHGTGVVIGETAEIGRRVRIYQGVTLGAKSFPIDEHGRPIKGIKRHPVVEDDVIIYSGATILGRVVIGRGSVIGGNVWLTQSVPPNSRVTQARAREDLYNEGGGI